MDRPSSAFYPRSLHYLAWLTTLCVFPLIFMGGLVTSHKAGLAVPDWPNSYGYNMFLFPISLWTGGIFYEHTHRLLGTLVGFCSILMVLQAFAPAGNRVVRRYIGRGFVVFAALTALATAWLLLTPSSTLGSRTGPLSHVAVFLGCIAAILCAAYFPRQREPRKWVRILTIVLFLAILGQGILGGLRVDLVNLYLAIIHGCFAQAVFCLAVFMILVTSRRWVAPAATPAVAASVSILALATVGLIYGQLIVGATMRHFDAGLAIPDFPTSYGQWIPPANDLPAINTYRDDLEPPLPPVNRFQVWIHFSHRIGALVVTTAILALVTLILTRYRRPGLTVPAVTLLALLALQILLGILSVIKRKPADIATSHVACGALVLVTAFVIAIRSLRLYRSPVASSSRQEASDTNLLSVPA